MAMQESNFNNKIFPNIKKKIYNINDFKNDDSDESDNINEYVNKIYIFKNFNFVKCTIKLNYNILNILETKNKNTNTNKIQKILKEHKTLSPYNSILPSNESDIPNFINSVGGGEENIFERSFSYDSMNINNNIDIIIENNIKEMLRYILKSQEGVYNPNYNKFHIIYDDIGSNYEGEGNITEFF